MPVDDRRASPSKGERTRRAVLAGTQAIINEGGTGSVSQEAVAKRAGISQSAVRHYYPTKDGLLAAAFNEVLAVNAKSAGGVNLNKPEWTFLREVKGSGNTGMKLLGNQLGTEKTIEEFLATIDKERKGRLRRSRDWDNPLYIDIASFGAVR